MMPRVFHPLPAATGDLLRLEGDAGHHFARVLRVSQGETVAIVAAGVPYLADVEAVDGRAGVVLCRIREVLPGREPRTQVYLVQGLPKGDKIETIVQKCTEVGAAGVHVMACRRSVARLDSARAKAKLGRWRRIAAEAASQSQRDLVPDVWYSTGWTELSAWLGALRPDLVLVCDEAETARGMGAALRAFRQARGSDGPVRLVIAVGPEGGWDDQERQRWLNEAAAVPVTLGGRILRTETAGVVALSAVFYEFGDLEAASTE